MRRAAVALGLVAFVGCRGLTIQEENDKFTLGPSSDRDYTQGLRVSSPIAATKDAPWLRGIAARVRSLTGDRERDHVVLGVSLGQDIFTPTDTEAEALIPDDRPYAGWLYGSVYVDRVDADGRTMDTIELQLGVIGPAARAEQAQNNVHELIGVSTSKGWDNQLPNEPGIQLNYRRMVRLTRPARPGFGSDLAWRYGAALGTVYTDVRAGATYRVGWGVPRHFAPTLGRASPPTALVEGGPRWSLYAFGGVDGRYVIRNAFVDGTLFRDSHHVDRRDFVADFFGGIALEVHGWQLSVTQVARSPEFGERGHFHRFVSISAGRAFTF